MTKVSVIVPVYNSINYLERCLESLVKQTLDDMEIVLINDGSTDNSPVIMGKFAAQYPDKVKVLNKQNGGQASARNMGIRECKGEYIGFVDSDDFVDTTMFEKMYNLAKASNSDFVECDFHYMDEASGHNWKELKRRGNVRKYKCQKEMFIDPQVAPWNKLYKREILLNNGLEFPQGMIYEDTAFYIKTIPYVKKQDFLDEKLVFYMLHGNSTMNANRNVRVGDIFKVLLDIIEFYQSNELYDEYKEEIEYFCVKILLCSSLGRIGRIQEKKLRNALLDETFDFINRRFPEYKNNKYFVGKKAIYIKNVNRLNAKYICRILGKVLKG